MYFAVYQMIKEGRHMSGRYQLILMLIFIPFFGSTQNYQAVHGSSYAGSLGVTNNPASIVHVPYSWDLTLFSVQAKHSSNAVVINNLSLLSSSANTRVDAVQGSNKYFLMANQDLRILNGRIRLNEESAIAFGAAIRSGQSFNTGMVNWRDTINSVRQFMADNFANSPLSAYVRGQAWAEIYGTYARRLMENDNGILNAGITLNINRGIGAAYVSSSELYLQPGQVHGQAGYLLNDGKLDYGYSSNLDEWDQPGTSQELRKAFLKKTWSSLSLNLGAEYIIPAEDEDYYKYDLKLGVSLLDLGFNKYQYSTNSRSAVMSLDNISDSLVEATFEGLEATRDLPDSIAQIAGSIQQLAGYFRVFTPARLVINADKRITGNLFINAELTLPLTSLLGQKKLYVREMSLAALTPRFETRSIGFYLPVTLNTRGEVWMGAAIKLGPLLAGVHNLSNVFTTNTMQHGGAYLAVNIRPFQKRDKEERSSGEKRSRGGGGRKGSRYGCPGSVL
jgi:Family of unknown function (DUF5723)